MRSANQPRDAPGFRHNNIARAAALIQSDEAAGVVCVGRDYGKDCEIAVRDWG